MDAPVYLRENVPIDTRIEGPALILDATGTVVVDHGFHAVRNSSDYLLVRTSDGPASPNAATAADVDPVLLEVFNNQFKSIAEQMGVVLQRTAMSTNIRDRLDFSCAVFDSTGGWSPTRRTSRCTWARWVESVRAVLGGAPG